MKFAITRAKLWFAGDKPPHPDAVRVNDEWVIDVQDLNALLLIAEEHGIIFNKSTPAWLASTGQAGSITIYDDYVE